MTHVYPLCVIGPTTKIPSKHQIQERKPITVAPKIFCDFNINLQEYMSYKMKNILSNLKRNLWLSFLHFLFFCLPFMSSDFHSNHQFLSTFHGTPLSTSFTSRKHQLIWHNYTLSSLPTSSLSAEQLHHVWAQNEDFHTFFLALKTTVIFFTYFFLK